MILDLVIWFDVRGHALGLPLWAQRPLCAALNRALYKLVRSGKIAVLPNNPDERNQTDGNQTPVGD